MNPNPQKNSSQPPKTGQTTTSKKANPLQTPVNKPGTPPKKKQNNSLFFIIGGVVALLVVVGILVFRQTKLKDLSEKNQALIEEKMFQDSILSGLMNTFNEFEGNLSRIKEKEGLISLGTSDPEFRLSNTDQIQEDLQSIDQLLQKNEELIADLTAQIEKSDKSNRPLRNMVSRLRKQLKEREEKIVELTSQISQMDINIDTLNTHILALRTKYEDLIAQQTVMIEELDGQNQRLTVQTDSLSYQEEKINTAFYVSGSTKELKKKRILLNRRKLNVDFDRSAFTPINIKETLRIPIIAKKPRLATVHPSSSYVFEDLDQDKKIDQLAIIDPEAFWQSSKYLVLIEK